MPPIRPHPEMQHWRDRFIVWLKQVLTLILEELRPAPHPGSSSEGERIGEFMTTPAFIAHRGETTAAVRTRIGADAADSHVLVCDDSGYFLGAVPVAKLLGDAADTLIESHARNISAVPSGESLSKAVTLAMDTAAPALVVTDDSGRLQGIVWAGALLKLVHSRCGEVLKRFTGIRQNSEQAVSAIEGPPGRRVIHRLPWLLVGTFGSMVATIVMAGFEDVLRRNVEVAFFIPGLVYLADAIGTQSEAIAVRGLTFSTASIRRLWWGELQTGLLLGVTLAALVFPFIWIAFSASLALAVAFALIFASSVATSVGLIFPWLLTRLGKDPAYGSGPIATIIQDLLSLVIYFVIVSWLVF